MTLSLHHDKQLEWALRHSDDVAELYLWSDCLLQVGLDTVVESLRLFPDLRMVYVADDYLKDPQKEQFERLMRAHYPKLMWTWVPEMKVDGRHGR